MSTATSGSFNIDSSDNCVEDPNSNALSPATIGGIAAGGFVLVSAIILIIYFICRKKRRRHKKKNKGEDGGHVDPDKNRQGMTQKDPLVTVDPTIVSDSEQPRRDPILPYSRIRTAADLYKVLDLTTEDQPIRVLYLQPASSFHAPLICNMQVVPLGSAYNALSYAWGEDTPSLNLEVRAVKYVQGVQHIHQGVKLLITINLDSALRHLRQFSNGKALPIWVDAICINQAEGNPEKGPQLFRMREIYSQAQRTFVWLGRGTPDSEKVINYLNSNGRVNWSEAELLDDYTTNRAIYDKFLTSIMQSSWFSRLWIVQELIVSRNPLVMCGDRTISWPIIPRVVHMLRSHHLHLDPPNTEMTQFLEIPFILDGYRTQSFRDQEPRLHFWLTAFRTQWNDAKHQEDRIFALHGLANDRDHPDLQPPALHNLMPPVQVFTQVTKHAAITICELDTVCIGRGPNRMRGLPSWVPDYSLNPNESSRPLTHISFAPNESFSAGGRKRAVPPNSPAHYQFSASSTRYSPSGTEIHVNPSFDASCYGLVVDAIFMDTVSKRGMRSDLQHHDNDEALFEHLQAWGENASTAVFGGQGWPTLMDAYPETHETRQQALGRTLLCDRDANEKRLQPGNNFFSFSENLESDTRARQWVIPEAVREQTFEAEKAGMWRWMRKRRVFVTEEDGYMGMGPEEMKDGDYVVVVLGSGVPWVVRAKEGTDKCEFVGEW